MSRRGLDFVVDWVSENVLATGNPPEGHYIEALMLAQQCVISGRAKGISRGEIEEEVGPLVSYMQDAIKAANDAQAELLGQE